MSKDNDGLINPKKKDNEGLINPSKKNEKGIQSPSRTPREDKSIQPKKEKK